MKTFSEVVDNHLLPLYTRRGTSIRYVGQPHYDGCALAALAMLGDKSFTDMFAIVNKNIRYGDFSDWRLFSSRSFTLALEWKRIVRIAEKKLNLKISRVRSRVFKNEKTLKLLDTFKGPTLLAIDWGCTSTFHCVIWDPKARVFLDPGTCEADNWREYVMNISAFIELNPVQS